MPKHGLSDIMLCPSENVDTPEQQNRVWSEGTVMVDWRAIWGGA